MKYNIDTNTESVLTLSTTNMDYNYLIVAENRLFVAQRVSTGNDNTHDFFLKEVNPETGAFLSSFELNFESSDNLQSFTFIPATHEIVGRIPFNDEEKLLKFNIVTNTQSIVTLSPETEGFGDIIYINNATAGLPVFTTEANKGKVIRAYNFLGQQINIDTFNQPMILEYENGFRGKAIQVQK
ncbi:MAG: hypothetical protein ACLGH8_09955 [Bacteroidia bacterium]